MEANLEAHRFYNFIVESYHSIVILLFPTITARMIITDINRALLNEPLIFNFWRALCAFLIQHLLIINHLTTLNLP